MVNAKCRWILAGLIACLSLSPAWGARRDQVDPELAEHNRKLDEAHKCLVVAPLFLDRTTVRPGQTLKASALLVNNSTGDLVIPNKPGEPPSVVPTVGREVWYLKKSGRNGVGGGKEVSKDGRSPRGEHVHRTRLIKAGEAINLDSAGGEVDPAKEKLMEGDYEISVDFVNAAGRVTATGSARLRVELDGPARTSTPSTKHQAVVRKFWQPNFEMLPMTLSATTVQRGQDIEAKCGLRNTSGTVVIPYGALPGPWTDFGTEQWTFGKCVYTRMCDRGQGAGGCTFIKTENPNPNLETGHYLGGFGGQMIFFDRERKKEFSAGEIHEFKKTIKTGELTPGTYEIRLYVGVPGGGDIGVRRQLFTVTQ